MRLGHGRPVDLALFAQPAKELLKGLVARGGRRWRGALKLGRDERLDVLPTDTARRGRHAPAGQERHQERPVVAVGADRPRGEVGRLQAETPGWQKYAKLSNAGGVWCGLAEVLDSTLCYRQARPARVTKNRKPQVR